MATAAGTLPAVHEQTGIWSWVTTVDHKRIGTLYGTSAMLFFMMGGLEAVAVRTQLAVPRGHVLEAERYDQLFTMHAITMIFLAIMPLGAAFFNWFTPLMIGARDLAFPRINLLSWYVYVVGAAFTLYAIVAGGLLLAFGKKG